jgi:hypothetical protein
MIGHAEQQHAAVHLRGDRERLRPHARGGEQRQRRLDRAERRGFALAPLQPERAGSEPRDQQQREHAEQRAVRARASAKARFVSRSGLPEPGPIFHGGVGQLARWEEVDRIHSRGHRRGRRQDRSPARGRSRGRQSRPTRSASLFTSASAAAPLPSLAPRLGGGRVVHHEHFAQAHSVALADHHGLTSGDQLLVGVDVERLPAQLVELQHRARTRASRAPRDASCDDRSRHTAPPARPARSPGCRSRAAKRTASRPGRRSAAWSLARGPGVRWGDACVRHDFFKPGYS